MLGAFRRQAFRHTERVVRYRTFATSGAHSPDVENVRREILSMAINLVPQHSFSRKAISEAINLHGYPATMVGLFPNQEIDLIEFLMRLGIEHIRAEHAMYLADHGGVQPGTTKTVTFLARKRLEFMAPVIHMWPDALKQLARPANVPVAIRGLHGLVDEIWHLAGDRSVDFNYYTKRGLLAGVYGSTELFMTQDHSSNFERTWEFLQDRLHDSAKVGIASGNVKRTLEWGGKNLKGFLNSKGIPV